MSSVLKNPRIRGIFLTAMVAGWPSLAAAHSFGRLYTLPVPFWLYAYGAAAALVLSFVVAAFFASASGDGREQVATASGRAWSFPWRGLPTARILSLFWLLLCIVTGLIGSRDPYRNLNMTAFWILFVLVLSYVTALIGDVYALVNPWRSMSDIVTRLRKGFDRGRFAYPQRLAYWPALALYMAFIWFELFGHIRPFSLSVLLLAYSGITLAGVWLFGAAAWFRYGEFFSVFFRLIALMAPVELKPDEEKVSRWRFRLRAPFAGLLSVRAEHFSLLLFVLFMLSSTAYDGLHSTKPWFRLFWTDPFGIITPLIGTDPIHGYIQLRPYYLAFEATCLALSPFLYAGVYLLLLGVGRVLVRTPISLLDSARWFAFSLLPIALVYNVTHYFTLILSQGLKIVSLLSDPFGWGWDLFGTAMKWRAPILPAMGTIWHTQVGLILFGHIVSVVIAHIEAVRIFGSRRAAVVNQLPMLLLMVLFTTAGLWILAQPIQSGR